MDAKTAIKAAREAVGGNLAELARRAGVQRETIATAARNNRVSAELAMRLQAATDDAVLASDMRPDLPWPLKGAAPLRAKDGGHNG